MTPADRGSTTLETAIVVPGLLLLIGLLVLGGRVALAHQATQAAADDAARTASIARTQSAAESGARSSALASLGNRNLSCQSAAVAVDTSAFSTRVGTPGHITATVTCVVSLGDLLLPGVPGTHTVTATAVSPLDTYRERDSGFMNSEGSPRMNPGGS